MFRDFDRSRSEAGKLGFIEVFLWNDLIENLYVLPEKQSMGYGSRLLRFTIDQCRKHPLNDRLWELEMEWK